MLHPAPQSPGNMSQQPPHMNYLGTPTMYPASNTMQLHDHGHFNHRLFDNQPPVFYGSSGNSSVPQLSQAQYQYSSMS